MSTLPDGLEEFAASAAWGDAAIEPLAGDASFRRYFRLRRAAGEPATAMLMHAPPPEEDPGPFLHVAHWLSEQGMRAPEIYAEDAAHGWVLTEDFGDDRMRDWLDLNPDDERRIYEAAVDALCALHTKPAGPFAPYDMETYLRETRLFVEWFTPAIGLSVDEAGFDQAWENALAPMQRAKHPASPSCAIIMRKTSCSWARPILPKV